MFKKFIFCLTILVTILSMGCFKQAVYYQTEANAADVVERVGEARHKSDGDAKPRPTLLVNKGSYVDRTPISLQREPCWMRNHIVLRGDDLPFSYYARIIANAGGPGVLSRFQVGLDPSVKVSMNYSGSVKGALDLLSSRTAYVYVVNDRDIYWQAFITRTYDIAFMPGSSDYMMGKAQGSTGGTQTGAGNVITAMIDDSAAAQYSNLKATLSIWKDLESTIKQMLTPDGRVIVSEATTSVTVRDKASNVDLVSRYIANLNHNISKQVLVKVQVLEVSLSSDFTLGLDWNVIEQAFGNSHFIFNSTAGEPVSITALAGGGVPKIGFERIIGSATGVTTLLKALTQQGKVTIVSEPRVVALNNQVSVIRIVNQEGYLASVQNTTIPGVAGAASTITSQLTPGTLITGLTLYILPKILNNRVYLQVNADISSKISITKVSSSEGTTGTSIQVPNLTQKQFNQRSVIGSGDTLILSGFRKIENHTGAMQVLDLQALGGKGATQANTETIVLITPIVLPGYA